jgi:hypothetical protein
MFLGSMDFGCGSVSAPDLQHLLMTSLTVGHPHEDHHHHPYYHQHHDGATTTSHDSGTNNDHHPLTRAHSVPDELVSFPANTSGSLLPNFATAGAGVGGE